jgi:nucleotide-binding universal stress UspA family protein
MKKILVPTDFSPDSANAVKFAYLFAKENKCKFSLLNAYSFLVYDPNMPPDMLSDVIRQSGENSAEGLDLLIGKFEKSYPDFKNYIAGKITADGIVTEAIEKTVEEGKFDLVIMGTKGASGLEEVLIGSNAYSVLSKSKVPVLVVPNKSQYEGLTNILYAVDLTCSELHAINELKEIIDLKKKDITFLHLSSETEEHLTFDEKKYLDEIKESLNDVSFKFEFAKCESVPEALEKFTHSLKADLIVVSKKKRDFLENLFHKSISKKLACHTDIPLLALQK